VFNPDVLLLDEPLGALDKNLREQMQVEIKRIHRELGITMIYVTHDQTEAMTMSDRIAVFSNGRLEQVGSPLDVYNRPVNRFVGEFIGDSNFFSGRADPARPGVVALAGLGEVRVAQSSMRAGDVTLLIRPERLRVARSSEQHDNVFDMTVDDIINYGDSILAIGNTRGLPLRVRMVGGGPDALARGMSIKVGWRISIRLTVIASEAIQRASGREIWIASSPYGFLAMTVYGASVIWSTSASSSADSVHRPARTLASTCATLVAPAITLVTAGLLKSQL
jgi:ABC-type Fe3+/spermidine/putrescine transport system ATPase subunit